MCMNHTLPIFRHSVKSMMELFPILGHRNDLSWFLLIIKIPFIEENDGFSTCKPFRD